MMEIFWPLLWTGTIIFFVSYIKIREGIPKDRRNIFEQGLMIFVIIFLIVNCFLIIFERKDMASEMNDCIRFYQTFPMFYNDSEFYFINEWCYEYFTPDEIIKIRRSASQKYNDDSGFDDFINSLKLNYTGGEK